MAEEIRLYSLEEVNALIPKLEMIMERMQRCGLALRREVEELAAEIGEPAAEVELETILETRPEVRRLATEIDALTDEIQACGGQLKGFDLGLVDFPAEVEGEIALLCWQFGEKEVAYWHSLDGGFSGRRPLKTGATPILQ